MKNIRVFLFEKIQFLEVKFSIYLNRRVFVMDRQASANSIDPVHIQQNVLSDQDLHCCQSSGQLFKT